METSTSLRTKICIHCKKPIALYLFGENERNPDGYNNVCTQCRERTNANRHRKLRDQSPASDTVPWQRLAADIIEMYERGATFEALGRRLRDTARKIERGY
jgi:hypothetical protein